jgi:mannose-6-phosphate isomerase-like protein (cupin superfamily)
MIYGLAKTERDARTHWRRLSLDTESLEHRFDMYWKENDSTDVTTYNIHGGDGEIQTHGFFEAVSKIPIDFQVWELDPGVSEGNHVHEGDDAMEEIYYFISGTGVMSVGVEEVPFRAGDAMLVPPGVDHGFRNTGDEPLRLTIISGAPLTGR